MEPELRSIEQPFSILNMRTNSTEGDLTTRAKIRDAGIECYGTLGVRATTARKVAAAAGVSAGSVIHHFGSMDGLRSACDEFVAARIMEIESTQLRGGLDMDPTALWRGEESGRIGAYLARVLVDDSLAVARLVDHLVDDAEKYLEEGVDEGVLRPSTDPRSRAAVLVLWSLGVFVLHEHAHRLLGVDLTQPIDPSIDVYSRTATEILGGILAEPIHSARTEEK